VQFLRRVNCRSLAIRIDFGLTTWAWTWAKTGDVVRMRADLRTGDVWIRVNALQETCVGRIPNVGECRPCTVMISVGNVMTVLQPDHESGGRQP
jgi:hypothetical protein